MKFTLNHLFFVKKKGWSQIDIGTCRDKTELVCNLSDTDIDLFYYIILPRNEFGLRVQASVD